jgi:phosphopantetheinyl transferase (holo-ACP synthase)
MIAGIGLDFIAVSRIAHWLEDELSLPEILSSR